MSELKLAMFQEALADKAVRCNLCAHGCKIPDGQVGVCRVRKNVDGELRSLNFDKIIATNADPIEKKPLFHFLPGSRSLSIAAPGCNFRCGFCQNWRISQMPRHSDLQGEAISPEKIVELADRHDCDSISYTYTEPTIFFELAYETAEEAVEQGLANCFVSNGYMTAQAVQTIAPLLDAINVDLKAFREETYRNIMGASLQPVLECLKNLVSAGVWVEVTTLIVPDMNDSEEELSDIAGFIANELGQHVPWHVSRFHGQYEMTDRPATSMALLERACRAAQNVGLQYVYAGNATGLMDESTYCPNCKVKVIDRVGFSIRRNLMTHGQCPECGHPIDGVWA